MLWAAGVVASPIVKMLRVPTDRAGRVLVGPSMNVPDKQGVFVVGDAAVIMQDGRPLPGVAQVAIQSGKYVGRLVADEIAGRTTKRSFRYFNKGNFAVVGKNVALLERNEIRLSGFVAWLIWAFTHIAFLPQLQNRLRVEIQWFWSYFTGQRGARLIPETPTTWPVNDVKKAKAS